MLLGKRLAWALALAAATSEPRPAIAPRPAPSPEAPSWSTSTTLRGAVAFGFAPKGAPGIELAAKVFIRRKYALEVGALWVSETSGDDPAYRFGTTLAGLGGCRVVSLGPSLYVDACLTSCDGACIDLDTNQAVTRSRAKGRSG